MVERQMVVGRARAVAAPVRPISPVGDGAWSRSEAQVRAFLPRRARPPWVKPAVLVVGGELPSYLQGEEAFSAISSDELEGLARAWEQTRARPGWSPVVAVAPGARVSAADTALLARLATTGFAVAPLAAVAQQRCRLVTLDDSAVPVVRRSLASRVATRLLDLMCGAAGVVVLALVLPVVALALWLEDRGPVFYGQERVGRGGRIFKVWKFRSMRPDAEPVGPAWATFDDDRTTRVGAFLRRYKLDELPQFVNVLVGDMAMIGPRPERPYFVSVLRDHIPHYDFRHSVRPGLTGWGTVRVGYGNSIEAKYLTHMFDLYHLGRRSLLFDIEILARSIVSVVRAPEMANRFML